MGHTHIILKIMDKQELKKQIAELKAKEIELQAKLDELDKKPTPKERFLGLFNGCEVKIDKKKYPDSVFLFKGEELFFEIENPYLWCSYRNVWSVFEKEYMMKYPDIRLLIKEAVEDYFKIKGIKPEINSDLGVVKIEDHFKTTEITPEIFLLRLLKLAEDLFKIKGITPAP